MTEKIQNKFNNVTCYLTSSSGDITVDAPFAGLPQYDINIAPTGITPGVYKAVSIEVNSAGQIVGVSQGVDTGTKIKSGSLVIKEEPGEITINLPNNVPLNISSGSLKIVQDASGGYTVDLLPNVVTSVTNTYPSLVSSTINDNNLVLTPNAGLITGVSSNNNIVACERSTQNPSEVDVTASAAIVTNVASGNTDLLTITESTDSVTGGTSLILNPVVQPSEKITVQTSNPSLLGVSENGLTVSLTPNSSLVTKAAIATGANSSTASMSVANNTVTLTTPLCGFISDVQTTAPLTATLAPTSSNTSTLTLGYNAPGATAIFQQFYNVNNNQSSFAQGVTFSTNVKAVFTEVTPSSITGTNQIVAWGIAAMNNGNGNWVVYGHTINNSIQPGIIYTLNVLGVY